jgi:hypothetical protein
LRKRKEIIMKRKYTILTLVIALGMILVFASPQAQGRGDPGKSAAVQVDPYARVKWSNPPVGSSSYIYEVVPVDVLFPVHRFCNGLFGNRNGGTYNCDHLYYGLYEPWQDHEPIGNYRGVNYKLPGVNDTENWKVRETSKRRGDPALCGVFSEGVVMDPMRAYNVQWDCPRKGEDCEIKIQNQWQFQMQLTKWGESAYVPALYDEFDGGITILTIDAYGTLLKPANGTLYSNPFVPGENTVNIDQILIEFSTDYPNNSRAECEYTYDDPGDGSDEIFFELEIDQNE